MSKNTALTLPKREEKRPIQAHVNAELWRAVEKKLKADGVTIKSVVEYGLKCYLKNSDPELARSLGI